MVLTVAVPLVWPIQLPPHRQLFWRRGVVAALVPVLLVAGQAALSRGLNAAPWTAAFLAVSAAYLLSLIHLTEGGAGRDPVQHNRVRHSAVLLSLAATTASLIVLSHALQFIVSVCTLLFLGANLPLRWHQRFTLPVVAATVWLISVNAARPPDLTEALSNGAGLLMTAIFGLMLRRSTRLSDQLAEAKPGWRCTPRRPKNSPPCANAPGWHANSTTPSATP